MAPIRLFWEGAETTHDARGTSMDAAPPRCSLLDGTFYADDPRPAYAWLRREGPVWRDPASGLWAVAGYDAVVAASTTPRVFSSSGGARPSLGPLPFMIDMDDPAHAQRRRLVSRGFTPRRVADREARLRTICDALIDSVCDHGECDLVSDIAAPLPLIVIGDLLGAGPADRGDLLRWSDAMVASQSASGNDVMTAAKAAFAEYYVYASRAIRERQATPTDDLCSVLATAEVDGARLDEVELIYELLLLLIGGDETTRHVISGGIEAVLRRPAIRERLATRQESIPRAVEEMLRWTSPVKTMARTVSETTEFFGAELASGDEVVLLYESANFDDSHFVEPEQFDPDRSPNDHLAFGVGGHFCLGASLARLELRILTERLFARLPDLELAAPELAPALRPNSFASGPMHLPVRFTPTEPAGVKLDTPPAHSSAPGWSWDASPVKADRP